MRKISIKMSDIIMGVLPYVFYPGHHRLNDLATNSPLAA
jgi:hypothetical protein